MEFVLYATKLIGKYKLHVGLFEGYLFDYTRPPRGTENNSPNCSSCKLDDLMQLRTSTYGEHDIEMING